MKTEWDYTELAAAYVKRADYAKEAIEKMIEFFGLLGEVNPKDIHVCDVGAGE